MIWTCGDFFAPYNPDQFVVLNWCEAIPGIAHSDALAADVLEEMGFAYSGSPPPVLRLSGDKEKVKDVLSSRRCADTAGLCLLDGATRVMGLLPRPS